MCGFKYIRAGDLIYLDPPFFQTEGRLFRQYTSRSFMRNDLRRLTDMLRRIDAAGATFLLSYAQNNDAKALLREWPSLCINIHRNISGFANTRGKSTEIIFSNNFL